MRLIPKSSPCDDNIFNRRILAYYGLLFSVYWVHLMLVVYTFFVVKGYLISTEILLAFLATPATLAGLNVWKYLKASEVKDAENQNNNRISLDDSVGGTNLAHNNITKEFGDN